MLLLLLYSSSFDAMLLFVGRPIVNETNVLENRHTHTASVNIFMVIFSMLRVFGAIFVTFKLVMVYK